MPTFSALFRSYMTLHARLHCRSWRNMERMYTLYLSHWADRDAETITRMDVRQLQAELAARISPTTANRVIELIRPVFKKGIEFEIISNNPVTNIKKFKLQSRERFLSSSEVRRLFTAIDKLRYAVTRDFLLMCLFTGARRSNVAAMRWDEINLDQMTWRIPRTKNGRSQYVPLTPQALAVLDRRRHARVASDNPWIFPSYLSSSGHLTKPELAWSKVILNADLPGVRIHDLRRTLASWEALTGANLAVIQQSLGHQDINSTLIYAKLNTDAVRQAMMNATDAMLK